MVRAFYVNEKNKGEADPRVELTPDDLKRIEETKKIIDKKNPAVTVFFTLMFVFGLGVFLFTLLFIMLIV